MSSRLSGPSAGALLLPLLSLAACGGADGVADATARDGTAAGVEPMPAAAGAVASDLDGLSIRRVGLARFDVSRLESIGTDPVTGIGYGISPESGTDLSSYVPSGYGLVEGDLTQVEVGFTALDEPLDGATLARIAAMPDAGASGTCHPVDGDETLSIGALFETLGSPLFAGEVITVSRAEGSWFELWGVDDEPDGPFYETRGDRTSFLGVEGPIEAGTTMDVPGDAFPAFAAVTVPPMASLSDVVDDTTEVRWRAGGDSDVPVVIDVSFHDYVEILPAERDTDGVLTDSDFGTFTDENIRVLAEAPADMRCVTRDTGRFVYPDALRTTIERFEAAGRAVTDRLAPGSDLDAGAAIGVSPDGSLTDRDEISVSQGRGVSVGRIATRYRVEGDALLIVQSSNGGTL